MYVFIVARHRLGKNVTAATNTLSSRRIVGRFFSAVHVVSKESGRLVFQQLLVTVQNLTSLNFEKSFLS
jgi:hypothetical protein